MSDPTDPPATTPADAVTLRLNTDAQAAGAEEARTIAVAAPLQVSVNLERTGDFIGRYRLITELGQGGFGTVWRAEQSEPIRREVALKVIKAGMDSREIIARFAAERQALALMDHPNIAAVLDAGATAGGRPYFAMELVKGVPLTDYCNAHRLGIRERLELFIPVCHAVQHAHQKAILHRDLKPSNILITEVDGKPVPKVIDFGIAKALGSSPEEVFKSSLMQTQAGLVIGTPQYMSPEQAGSVPDVDTRSDIYTLGVILYELLTGGTPLRNEQLKQAALDEVLRLIREGEAKRPSSCFTPVTAKTTAFATERRMDSRHLSRSLRGDLDWIVLKALEKERERRYETANALAADILRHLHDEPVTASPPSKAYRLRKLAWKHRTAFAAAAAVVLALVLGLALAAWRYSEEAKARALAQFESQKSAALLKKTQLDRAEELFDADDPSSGIAYLASVLRRDPHDRITGARLLSALRDRPLARMVAGPWQGDGIIGWEPDGGGLLIRVRENIIRWRTGQMQPDPTPLFSAKDITQKGPVGFANTWQPVLSPNGRQLLCFQDWGACRLYDLPGGTPTGPLMKVERAHAGFNAQESSGFVAAFSPDAQSVAIVMASPIISVWDTQSGALQDAISPGPGGNPTYAAFSSSGKWLAVGTRKGVVELRQSEGGKWQAVQQWQAGSGHIRKLTFVRDQLLILNHDHELLLVHVQDGKAAGQPVMLGAALNYDVHNDNDVVVMAARNKVELLSLKTQKPLMPAIDAHDYVKEVSITKDGRCLLVTTESNLQLWSFDGSEMMSMTRRFPSSFSSDVFDVRPNAQLSPDGRFVAVSQADGSISVWQTETARSLPLCYPLEGQESLADLHQDGERLAVASTRDTVVVNLATGKRESPVIHAAGQGQGPGVFSLAFKPHSTELWLGLAGPSRPINSVQPWHWPTGQLAGPGLPLVGYAFELGFDQSGNNLYVRGNASHLYVAPKFSERQGGWTATNATGFGGYSHLAVDGRTLLQLNREGTAMTLWDIASGQPLSPVFATEVAVETFFPTLNNEWCATAHPDGSAQIWDAHTGKPVGPVMRHKASISDVSMHLPSDLVATASADHTARLWHASTGTPLGAVMRHQEMVFEAKISPDGTRLATSSFDQTARVWDVPSGRPLTEALPVLAGFGQYCLWHPDGARFITSGSSPAQCWDVPVISGTAPPWLADWAEAVGGYKLDDQNELIALPLDADRRFRDMAASMPPQDAYAKTLRWFYESTSTRTLSPNAQVTRHDLVTSLSRVPDKTWLALSLAADEPLSWVARLWSKFARGNAMDAKTRSSLARVVENGKASKILAPAASLLEAILLQQGGWSLDKSGYMVEAQRTTTELNQTIAALRKALELGLDEHWEQQATLHLARLHALIKEPQESLSMLDKYLGPVQSNDRFDSERKQLVNWRIRLLRTLGNTTRAAAEYSTLLGISPRDPSAPLQAIDLSLFYNSRCDEPFDNSGDFSEVPDGTSTLGGLLFDVRGSIQLCARTTDMNINGNSLKADLVHPKSVVGIPVSGVCQRLHFLHCAGRHQLPENLEIGAYVIHYADGQETRIPLFARKQLPDRHRMTSDKLDDQPVPQGPGLTSRVVWQGHDVWSRQAPDKRRICLYTLTWENPRLDVPVTSIDLISNAVGTAMCVFAISRE